MAKILVVEDDPDTLDCIVKMLSFEHHAVETCLDGDAGWHMVRTYDFDLLILDWEIPEKSGVQICRDFRSLGGRTPILMLTGKVRITDKEEGLDSGADDYLTKPFDLRELAARVRALLRRPVAGTDNILQVADIVLDPIKYHVTKGGTAISLLPKEFQLLEYFMRHGNEVISPQSLLNHVWPSESDATVDALRTNIKRLRKKIDPEGERICTVHGVGYIFKK